MKKPIPCMLFGLALILLLCPYSSAPERPNMVFILVDDKGYSDPGCFGAEILETPNIDKLADQYPEKLQELKQLWKDQRNSIISQISE